MGKLFATILCFVIVFIGCTKNDEKKSTDSIKNETNNTSNPADKIYTKVIEKSYPIIYSTPLVKFHIDNEATYFNLSLYNGNILYCEITLNSPVGAGGAYGVANGTGIKIYNYRDSIILLPSMYMHAILFKYNKSTGKMETTNGAKFGSVQYFGGQLINASTKDVYYYWVSFTITQNDLIFHKLSYRKNKPVKAGEENDISDNIQPTPIVVTDLTNLAINVKEPTINVLHTPISVQTKYTHDFANYFLANTITYSPMVLSIFDGYYAPRSVFVFMTRHNSGNTFGRILDAGDAINENDAFSADKFCYIQFAIPSQSISFPYDYNGGVNKILYSGFAYYEPTRKLIAKGWISYKITYVNSYYTINLLKFAYRLKGDINAGQEK